MAPRPKCTECGCLCRGKNDQAALHLHVEIENLKQKLLERENHIVTMETNFLTEVDKFPNGECAALAEELLTWQDKYSRLYEAHRRVQKVNQNLEDKLLKIVDKCETEKTVLTKEINSLKHRLVEADSNINWLKDENERNRNDVNLAIQLLQCKPSHFVPQKFESLPVDLQHKVKVYMNNKGKCGDANNTKHEMKTIKVPIPTFPPTAMFYSVNKASEKDNDEGKLGKPVDIVSAAIVAKILQEREKERLNTKHCTTCICPSQRTCIDQAVQTCLTEDNGRYFLENNLFGASKNHIIKIESYQSQSPSVSSAILIERTALAQVPATETPAKKAETVKLSVGRNRYQSSKLSRGLYGPVKKDKQDEVVRNSEIYIDGSVRFSDVNCDVLRPERPKPDVTIDMEDGARDRTGPRRCSVSVQMGSSNILLDNATCYAPAPLLPSRTTHPYALVHTSRSHSTSSSASSIDDFSADFKPTETQI